VTGERSRRIEVPFPGGQSYRDVVDQTASLLEDLRARHDGQTVVLIGHSANLWALEHLLAGAQLQELVDAPSTWQEGRRFRLDT
jgi:alpha-ribazole phosphatase/probable phosphoglycerate mutase